MDGSGGGSACQIEALRSENEYLRLKLAALEHLAGIDAAEIKRLNRLLKEAECGAAARKNGPSTNGRAVDKV